LQNTGTAKIANYLERHGFRAYPIPASYTINRARLAAVISHKLVARAAGLGWIGKNGLFLTPQEGPRVRLASILTDAPLATGKPMASACGNCQICEMACPAEAIKGREFDEREADAERLDPAKCSAFIENRKKEWGIQIERCICGMCVAVCPFGKKRVSK
jgi:epoxyqueuosine reductase